VATNIQQCVTLLKKMHLFNGLSDERLAALAGNMGELVYENAEDLYAPGDKADAIYIVFKGGAKVSRKSSRKPPPQPDHYTVGDYFGLEPAFKRSRREAKAEVEARTTLLVLKTPEIIELIKESPHFKNTIQIMDTSRKNSTRLFFKWLQPDETLYLIARKHFIALYQTLLGPAFLMFVPLFFLFLWGLVPDSSVPPTLAATSFLLDVVWIIWLVVDYENDFYIITNRRIVWVEKVVFLYDSRQESPISQILSGTVETGFLGRLLDFGEVVVRTYTSRITFKEIEHPYQVKAMLDEYLNRTKDVSRRQEVDAMKQAIRTKLGLVQPKNPPAPPASQPPKAGRLTIPRLLVRELFKMRTEDAGKIVYRKHWFVLLRQAWLATLAFLLDLVGMVYIGFSAQVESRLTVIVIMFTALLFIFGWWVYQFANWRNDRFELTSEQIMDIDKVPFGTEERKSGKLEDIQSINYQRIGLLGYLLNFGTVFIMVGTTEFTFDEVHDPALVQAEIEEWRNRRLVNKRNAETASERERMAEWIAAYHNNRGEFLPPEN
jgi:hypothetical protein